MIIYDKSTAKGIIQRKAFDYIHIGGCALLGGEVSHVYGIWKRACAQDSHKWIGKNVSHRFGGADPIVLGQ